MRYTLMSGAGNLFAVVDGFEDDVPPEPERVARELCAGSGDGGIDPKPDGLILMRSSSRGADCAMEIYNADGSRPEACGNGLRCVAKLFADRGHARADAFRVETDAGVRDAVVVRRGERVVGARVDMGTPRVAAIDEPIRVGTTVLQASIVDMGNPHCVLFVEDERRAPVAEIGSALQHHPSFPAGTNVGFLAQRADGFHLRVWERGVGETQACGSGACAAAVAAVRKGLAHWPVRIDLPGGRLEVDTRPDGGVELGGPVEELARGEWSRAPVGRTS